MTGSTQEDTKEKFNLNMYMAFSFVLAIFQLLIFSFPQLQSIIPEGWQIVPIFIIIGFLLQKTDKIHEELKPKASAVDLTNNIANIEKKIDQINNKQSGSLLVPGSAWNRGAELIDELEDGDIIFACNLVSWKSDYVKPYIEANKKALKNGVKIKRLYAFNEKNKELAEQQSNWVKDKSWKQNFERRMYEAGHPMLDYILATDSEEKPKWAVLWIYTPEEKDPILLYGFHIIDEKSLEGMKKDFDEKWNNNELTTEA